jgi:hypothetical protein
MEIDKERNRMALERISFHLDEAMRFYNRLDLFGRLSIKKLGGGQFEGYYTSLTAIRPFITSEQWQASVTGFYINVAGDYDAVRLSYFTTSPEQVRELTESFMTANGLHSIGAPEIPSSRRVSDIYGNEELRFRRFLSTYTQIGLQIMEADLLNARCLFATFRWQVMLARQSYKSHFLRTFEEQSPFYNLLPEKENDQFWEDLAHWPNPPQVDWAHMFVNMVLGCDWIGVAPEHFVSPRPPLSIDEINEVIKNQGFQIPAHWRP